MDICHQPALSTLLKLCDNLHYLCFGEVGTGAVTLLVPPLAALQPHSATLVITGVSQAAHIKVTAHTTEGSAKRQFVVGISPGVFPSYTCYHSEHLPNGGVE